MGRGLQGGDADALRWVQRVVVFVDIAEAVRLYRHHEASVIERWTRFVTEVRNEVLVRRGGRFVKSTGDGFMLEFPHVAVAATTALEIQRRAERLNEGVVDGARIVLRAGIHLGEVVADPLDLLGDAVNYAARLTTLGLPGEVVLSEVARSHLLPGIDPEVEDLGERFVKHIDEPLRLWRLIDGQPRRDRLAAPKLESLRPTIAVMPFDDHDDHDPGAALGQALAADVVASLSRQHALQVVSSLSTRVLKRRDPTVAELGAQLGVAYVATGCYGRRGNGLRLMLELADTRSSTVIWADGMDITAAEVCDTGAGLADRVAGRLLGAIVQHEVKRTTTLPLPALESYALLFGAIEMMNRLARRPFDRAQQMLEHLSERLGRNGVAHAWLAMSHVLRRAQGWSADSGRDVQLALQHVTRSLESDPSNGLALAIGGLVHGYLRRDLVGAGRMYDEALETSPNEPLAWLFSSTRHAYLGDGAKARREAEMALSLSPLDPMRPFFDSFAATAFCGGGHWREAADLARSSLRANKAHASTWRTLTLAEVRLGNMDAAREAVQQLLLVEPGLTVSAFTERFPGRDGPMAEPWADALHEAGLPA